MADQFDAVEQVVQVHELFDAFDGDDLADVVSINRAQVARDRLLAAVVPPLTGTEVEHYWWLIGGLIDGGMRLVSSEYPASHALDALDCARELLDELMARVVPVEDAR